MKITSEDEFETPFKSLKRDKIPDFDNVHVNVVKSVFGEIKEPLKRVFKNSIKEGEFPEESQITKISSIFKTGKKELLTNHRPISVLTSFSKISERAVYNNKFYPYLNHNLAKKLWQTFNICYNT